jgi:hypothetical protein
VQADALAVHFKLVAVDKWGLLFFPLFCRFVHGSSQNSSGQWQLRSRQIRRWLSSVPSASCDGPARPLSTGILPATSVSIDARMVRSYGSGRFCKCGFQNLRQSMIHPVEGIFPLRLGLQPTLQWHRFPMDRYHPRRRRSDPSD